MKYQDMHTSAIAFSSDPFSVRFLSCDREPGEWDKEVFKAAFSLVAQAGNRPIIVCFSGGVDSEVLCQALFEQGVNFTTLTIADSKGHNKNDVSFATRWCRNHGIIQNIVRLDYENFYKNEVERYIRDGYFSVNLFRYFQLFLLEQVQSMGGFAVLGGGEPRLNVMKTIGGRAYMQFTSAVLFPYIWMQRNDVMHQPSFYLSSPELVLSYLRTPIVETVLRNPEMLRNKMNRFTLKRFVQQTYWPDVQSNHTFDDISKLGEQRFRKEKELLKQFEKKIDTLNLSVEDIRVQLEEALE